MNIKQIFKILMMSVILLTGTGYAQAGVVKKAIAYTVLKRASTYLMTGQGKKATVIFLKKAVENPTVEAALAGMLSYYMITMPAMGGDSIAKRSREIFIELNMNTAERAKTLNMSIDLFKTNYIYLTHTVLKDIEGNKKYSCINKAEIMSKKDKKSPIFPPYYLANGLNEKKLEQWDFASYLGLESRDPSGDHMEHDHIPSVAAIFKYIQKRDRIIGLNRKKGVGLFINNNATAVEIHEDYHRSGRTYGNKKAKDFDTISIFKNFFNVNYWRVIQDEFISAIDGKNLKLATVKDFAYYGLSVDLKDPKVTRAIRGVFMRNSLLCLYDK